MVRMFGELKHDMVNMKNDIRQEWRQDLKQEISTIRQDVSNLRQENHASIRHLETQVAQNSQALAEKPQGALPSTTVNNPREMVQVVTLQSGKDLPEPILKKSTNSKSPIEEGIAKEIFMVGSIGWTTTWIEMANRFIYYKLCTRSWSANLTPPQRLISPLNRAVTSYMNI
nr:uncharacterized protein LOC109154451 [Ipomoea batatas]